MKNILGAVLVCFTAVAVIFAEVPVEITYQGRLHEYGQPVSANRTMSFKIFDALTGGNQVWSSGNVNILVSNGVFSYVLTPTTVDWRAKNLWIETVISGKELSPREKITSQAFSLHSKTAEDIEKSAGQNIHFSIGGSTVASIQSDGNMKNFVPSLWRCVCPRRMASLQRTICFKNNIL